LSNDYEFDINEKTLAGLLSKKKEMGFVAKGWGEWFDHILNLLSTQKNRKSELENIMEKIYYEKFYEEWVKNFSLNLRDIWNESSARELDPKINPTHNIPKQTTIVIGRGPSIKKHGHLELLANSDFKGSIICCDGSLIDALKAGVTPEKFSKFYVVTIDPAELISKFYDDKIVDKYGNRIKGIFTTVASPTTVQRAREAGIKIHWLHALFDFQEGKKSFNQISALMVRAKNHHDGLPAIQTGGNVGTSSWFIAWQILKCSVVGLIGINHSWDEDDSWNTITSHFKKQENIDTNNIRFKKLFPKVYNPEFNCNCIMDPIFQYYSNALKEFILRSPNWLITINATEGGCIFGEKITCMSFQNFLSKY